MSTLEYCKETLIAKSVIRMLKGMKILITHLFTSHVSQQIVQLCTCCHVDEVIAARVLAIDFYCTVAIPESPESLMQKRLTILV